MNYKEVDAAKSTITRNTVDIDSRTGNIYEAIAIIAKRSNQIALEMKEELNGKLAEFATTTDNLDEVFENKLSATYLFFYLLCRPHHQGQSLSRDPFTRPLLLLHFPEVHWSSPSSSWPVRFASDSFHSRKIPLNAPEGRHDVNSI